MATALSLLPGLSVPPAPFLLHPTAATGRQKSHFLCPVWPRNCQTAELEKTFVSLHVLELNQILNFTPVSLNDFAWFGSGTFFNTSGGNRGQTGHRPQSHSAQCADRDPVKISIVRPKLQTKQKTSSLNDIDHDQESYWLNIDWTKQRTFLSFCFTHVYYAGS